MRKSMTALLVLVLFVVGLVACSTDTEILEDTRWILESYGGEGDLQAVLEGTEITATFNSQDGQVKGSGGCNTYFGKYQANKNELSISDLAWTEMACLNPKGVMEQEQQYLPTLRAAESYTVDNNELRISCSGGRILIFRVE